MKPEAIIHSRRIKNWKENPIDFFRFVWGNEIFIWDKLAEILDNIVRNKRTIVRSGHGVGKSWLMGRVALWWLYCNYPAKIITTAPTWSQVEKILWGEIRNAYFKSLIPLGGNLLQTELKLNDEWFAVGVSTSEKTGNREFGATKLQGYHSPNLLFILDEGAGVSPEIWTSATSLITGENNKIIAIGNPASPTGDFFEAFKSPIWSKVAISCFDHPNIKEDKMVISGCVSREWIEERKKEWGEESPLYKAKVLGEFPDESEDTLIPLSWVERAIRKDIKPKKFVKAGCDVARFGSDETIIFLSDGEYFDIKWAVVGKDTMEVSGKLNSLYREYDLEKIAVDDSGVGGGVSDSCKERGLPVQRVNFGEEAIEKEKFANLKAEMFWMLRERFKRDEIKIPDDDILKNQLANIRYSYTSKGQIKIESKDEAKRRGMKSPDRADALAICN